MDGLFLTCKFAETRWKQCFLGEMTPRLMMSEKARTGLWLYEAWAAREEPMRHGDGVNLPGRRSPRRRFHGDSLDESRAREVRAMGLEGSNRVSLPCKRSSDFTNASSVGNTSVMAFWYTRGETSSPAGSRADEALSHPGAIVPRRR